uniref:Uncharacterized protein n=1 Tax=Rhizophora mucronata TaxID=61149 RepID=A0A2P2Q0P8_RHIMU
MKQDHTRKKSSKTCHNERLDKKLKQRCNVKPKLIGLVQKSF